MKGTSVKLRPDLLDRLNNLSKLTAKLKSYYIHIALEEKLDELELMYLAKNRAENLQNGTSSTVSWESLKKENGL